MFLLLTLGLGAIHFLTLWTLGWFSNISLKPLVPFLLILFACFYFPYQTLFYQYIIPSLGNSEQKSYSQWEVVFSLTSIIGGLASFFLLSYHRDPGWFLILDAITFLFSGLVICFVWHSNPKGNCPSEEKFRFSALKKIVGSKTILIGAIGMWSFALLIDSFTENAMVISQRQFSIPYKFLGLFQVLFSVVSLAGSFLYLWFPSRFKNNYTGFQKILLMTCVPALFLLATGILFNLPLLPLLMLIWIGLIDPMWTTNNTLLLRSHIDSNQYGEIFGFIRVPRAILTFAGMSFVGWAQDKSAIGYTALLATFLILGVIKIIHLWKPHSPPNLQETPFQEKV